MRIALAFVVALSASWCLAPRAVAQCKATIDLADSTYALCNGVIYNNCRIELEVNRAGFWCNGMLAEPFESFIDCASDTTKDRYRATYAYRTAAQGGAEDREAMIAAALAECRELGRLNSMLSTARSAADLEPVNRAIAADPNLRDFALGAFWSDRGHVAGYWAAPDSLPVVNMMHFHAEVDSFNPRDWSAQLKFFMETYCEQIRAAEEMVARRSGNGFEAIVLGNGSGRLGNRSRDGLLEELRRWQHGG